HLFVFRGNAEIEDFPGNYTDFKVYEESVIPENKTNEKKEKKNWKKDSNSNKGLNFSEQNEHSRLEKEIKKLEEEKSSLESLFSEGNLSSDEINDKSKKLQTLIFQINEKTERWFELSDKLSQ